MASIDKETIDKIKQWVSLDNKIELKKIRLKEFTDERKALEEDIVGYVEQNNRINLQINTSDGYIDFAEQKSNQVMSLKYIKDALENFFASNHGKVSASEVLEHLLSNREQKSKVVMRRHITS